MTSAEASACGTVENGGRSHKFPQKFFQLRRSGLFDVEDQELVRLQGSHGVTQASASSASLSAEDLNLRLN